jgi:glycosyltransferase involved in cell wall biosynthesis
VYLEHNTPPGPVDGFAHPVSDRSDITLVHVTHCNALFWDSGSAPTRVIVNGIVDPGYRYTGEEPRMATVINDAERRGRATGTDLLARFAEAGPVDLYGFGAARLGGTEHIGQEELYDELARRRLYLHPNRWTSLSLSLMEAMHLGLPVVAVATTEVSESVPPSCGCVSTNVDRLIAEARALLHDSERARVCGKQAREAALERHGLGRFLADWDAVLEEVTR